MRPWKTYLVGVEAWSDYRNPVWDLYNVVHSQTIEEFLAVNSESFDCVLLGDVLEHFDKPAGHGLLQSIQPRVAPGGSLLVMTPARFFAQDAVYGNECERHRSYWSEGDLRQLGFTVEQAGQPDYFCGQCWFAEWRAPDLPNLFTRKTFHLERYMRASPGVSMAGPLKRIPPF